MLMAPRRPTEARVVAAVCVALVLPATEAAQSSLELRNQAAEYAYNLDHAQAIALLRQAIAADPQDSTSHRALASSIWLEILFQRGAVTVDHYLGGFSRARVDLTRPPPELDAEFRRELATCLTLAQRRVKAAPKDPQAHYDLGTALGLQASYIASVEGRLLAGLKAAHRSYDEQERVIELDPSRKDAGLIVGTYRYIVSTLSLPMRLMAYVVGFGGGKERGIRMVEEAAAAPGEDRTDAMFALVLLYNREKRYDDALRVLGQLRRRYPRNRLVLLEEGATATRANRGAEAERILTEGIAMLARDNRPRIPGEEALWHYRRGAARVLLGRAGDAQADLRIALSPGAAAGWVQGRAHLELGRLALGRGDRDGARREAGLAVAACEKDSDPICVAGAKRLQESR